MKIGLFTKLFLATLLTAATVVAGMALSVHWAFEHGLKKYLRQVEMESLDKIVPVFNRFYAQEKSWDALRNPLLFRQLVQQVLFEDNDAAHQGRRPPRLWLLDAHQQVISGPPSHATLHLENARALLHENQIVGWLAMRPNSFISDKLTQAFHRQQIHSYYVIAALALLVSALAAWLLVRQLLVPIKHLAQGVRALGNGDYHTRIQTQGSDELGRLGEDFNHLACALERNEQMRRQWFADISHELRTPLAVLYGEIEAMRDGVRPVTSAALTALHNETYALSKLVDDLYELALSDVGALDYRKELFDVGEVLEAAVTAFQPRFQAHGLALACRILSPAPVRADAARLTQLFGNLLENSLRYTDSGGSLEIILNCDKQRIYIDFQDSAPGVAEDMLEKLFERLYRADKSRSRALGGAGLGLAICRNIMTAHQGVIQARLSPLGGVWIALELPLQM
jgi:two-component system, OmpR family, sensor histidine kinase BaeS